MDKVGYLATTFLILIGGIVVRGWVLSILWAWFFVATFHVLPLSIAQAIGVGLIVTFMVPHPSCVDKERTPNETLQWGAGRLMGLPLLFLAIGAIVRLFLPTA